MSETKVNLTDKQIEHALTLYAHGKTSTQVIDDLLLEFEDLEDSPENRAMLREQLRSVNPSDKRFSQSKYGLRFDMVHSVIVEELRRTSSQAMRDVVNSIARSIGNLDDMEESLQSILDNASDFDVTSNTEYINTMRAKTALNKTKVEAANAVTGLVESLCKLHALKTGAGDADE